ncbi:MAG: PKD domain-containing protein, partial [Bacteroidota bacterium]
MEMQDYYRVNLWKKLQAIPGTFFFLLASAFFFFPSMQSYSQPGQVSYKLGPQLIPDNLFKVNPDANSNNKPMYDPLTGNLNTSCTNSNFSMGDWTGWTGCYGFGTTPPLPSCQDSGLLTGPPFPANFLVPLHKIMPAPSHLDYWSCGVIPTVFPGESFSARIGDTTTGRHGAELHYKIYVTSANYLFVYRYAVVLESPSHSVAQQPNFQVVIRDSVGNTLDPTCGYYYISAPTTPNTPPPGWTWCNSYGRSRYARPWTTVGMDLTPYVGRHITLAFIAKGCCILDGSHRGYAFVSAYCSSLLIQTAMCQGDTSATLTAPPGFAHYLWSTGDTTESITVPHPLTGATYSCTLTAFNNCTVTLTMTLTYTVVNADFTYTPDCPTYLTHFHDNSTVNQNQVVSWDWDWGDGTAGTTTNNPNPQHVFPNPGTFNVMMIAHSTEGCKDTIIKSVTIDTLALVTNSPMHKTICSGESVNIHLTTNVTGAGFTWTAAPQYPATTTGYHNRTVPSTYLNDTLFNTGLNADTMHYLISSHNLTCTSHDTLFKVVVLPKPSLANTVLSQSVCSGSPSAAVTLVPSPGPPAQVSFNWTAY